MKILLIILKIIKTKFPIIDIYSVEILTKYSNIILNILLIKLFNNNLTILKNEMNINNFANLKRIVYYLLPYIKIDDTTIRINNIGDLITKKKK